MSTFLQFFPNGGGSSSGGGGGNIGGGTTPVEIIGVSGGGGGGGCTSCSTTGCVSCGGQGGTGAIFYANNYYITPGTTYPITIGTGGAGGTCGQNCNQTPAGTNGGATIFCNPECNLCVAGGGGGGGASGPSNNCCPGSVSDGLKGGTGGAGGNWNKQGPYCCSPCRGRPGSGMYFRKTLKFDCNENACGAVKYSPTGVTGTYPVSEQLQVSSAEVLETPWGWMGGFPASGYGQCAQPVAPNCLFVRESCAGGMMGNAAQIRMTAIGPATNPAIVCCECAAYIVGGNSRYYDLTWGTCTLSLGNPNGIYNDAPAGDGCVAHGGATAQPGGPGILLIRYPDQYPAATPTGGGTDISPQTPGYYTYCFTSPGSITI